MKSKELADNVLVVWETLGSSRADDFAKPPVGFEQLTHQGLASIFEGWIEKIGALEKARWLTPDEIAVADHVIARRLADLPNLISTSTQHGLSWLYSTNFLELVADVNAQINGLTSRTARAGREALRSLQRDVITDLADVARAADEAQEVVTMAREMRGIRDAMVSASTSATTAADSAIRIAQQSDGVRVQISEAEAFIAARRQEIERLYAEATTSRDSADAKASQLEQRIGSLAIDVENATKQAIAPPNAASPGHVADCGKAAASRMCVCSNPGAKGAHIAFRLSTGRNTLEAYFGATGRRLDLRQTA